MPRHPCRIFTHCAAFALATGWALTTLVPVELQASSLRRTAEVDAIEHARPSVVSIHGRKTVTSNLADQTRGEGVQQVNGMGTGIVVDERGYIVTNYHVVEGVGRIQVTTANGKTTTAQLVSHDGETDLAIIKIDAEEPLSVIRIGTSQDLMPGEPVLAIGNAYGYTHTVTRGIISALHRPIEISETQSYPDLIQTDASINPGNSGGPLLNIDGEMIGINVAVRMGAQGIGFALPVDEAIEVVARLMDVEVTRRIGHGVAGKTTATSSSRRFVVTEVAPESGGAASGLRPGDIIQSANGRRVSRALDFECVLLGRDVGDEVQLAVSRGTEEIQVGLVLTEPIATSKSTGDQIWDVLGLRLTPAPTQTVRQQSSRYRGGLRVTNVRPSSPGARQGIRPGDILVGLHKWETVSIDNITYILANEEFEQAQPAKFYILRGGETLYGQLRVSSLTQ